MLWFNLPASLAARFSLRKRSMNTGNICYIWFRMTCIRAASIYAISIFRRQASIFLWLGVHAIFPVYFWRSRTAIFHMAAEPAPYASSPPRNAGDIIPFLRFRCLAFDLVSLLMMASFIDRFALHFFIAVADFAHSPLLAPPWYFDFWLFFVSDI